jgi:DNA polymerase-1
VIQGSAADALKVKLVELHKFLKGTQSGARLLLNVHDEFDMSVPRGDAKTLAEINRILTHFDGILTPIKFRVPVRTDQGVGPNWWEASK